MKSPELDDKTEGIVPVGFSDVLGHIYPLLFPIDRPKYIGYFVILRLLLTKHFYCRMIPQLLVFSYGLAKLKVILLFYRIKHFFHFNWFVFRCLFHNFLMLYVDAEIEPPDKPRWPNDRTEPRLPETGADKPKDKQ